MSEQALREAYQHLKRGQRKEAGQISMRIVKEDQDNVDAWWLLANVFVDDNKKRRALQEVLKRNPQHVAAERLLARVEKREHEFLSKYATEAVDFGESAPELSRLDDVYIGRGVEDREDAPPIEVPASVKYGLYGIAAFIVLVVVFAVGISVFRALSGPRADPADVAATFATALANTDFERVIDLSCRGDQIEWQESGDAISNTLSGVLGLQVSIDTSELTYTVVERSRTEAVVEISGTLRLSDNNLTTSYTWDEFTRFYAFIEAPSQIRLIAEGNEWRVCTL